jgi:hypothetical protein
MPSSDDRMRQAVDTDFAQWETEMSDGPATAQGCGNAPAIQPGWRVSAGRSYAENQCAGAGLVLW